LTWWLYSRVPGDGCRSSIENLDVTEMPQRSGVLENMPENLHYLIEPVLRYACRTEWDAFAHLDKATQTDMDYLAVIARKVFENDHYPLVTKFLNEYQMTEFDECAQLYFFFGLLDHGGLKFD
jgi:hypothetical protein